jgi:hypothetical protein
MIGFKIGLTELIAVLVAIAFIALFVIAWFRVFTKAGHSGFLCILMFLPVINLITFLWFAFSTWPLEKQLAALKRSLPPEPGKLP